MENKIRDFKGVWIPKRIWLDKNLSWVEKMLLVEIDSLVENGECFASNEYFATFFDLSKDRISKLISSLKSKNYIELTMVYKTGTKQIEKRIITTIGYRRKQLEGISEINHTPLVENNYTPLVENAEDNNTVINNTITNNKKDIYIVQFDEFWNLYPKKEGKKKCQDKYIKLLKDYSHETIMNGTINYVKQIKINRTEKQYIKQPLTFLNGEHFNDEFDFTNNKGRGSNYNKPVNEIDPEAGF